MSESEECTATGEIVRVLRLSRIFGLAPVHVTPAGLFRAYGTRTLNCYQVSASKKYGIISSICIIAIWLTGLVTYAYCNRYMDPEKAIRIRTGLSLVIYTTHSTFHDIILLFIVIRGLNKTKQIISYLNCLQKLNQSLNNSYYNLEINKSNEMIWGFVSSVYIISLIFICQRILDVIISKKSVAILVMQSIYFLSYSMHVLIQLQFAFVVYLLNATICVYNDRLQSWNCKWDYEFNNIILLKRKHIRFRRLCQIYVSICKLITKIDREEGAFILILLIYKILDMLDSLYLISSLAYFSSGNIMSASFFDFAVEIIWMIYRGATLVLLVQPCNQTDIELQVMKLRVSHLICATSKNYNREELFTLSRQLIIDLPVFCPLGVCSLRRQELVAIIGALFTFIVIITQFRLRDGLGY